MEDCRLRNSKERKGEEKGGEWGRGSGSGGVERARLGPSQYWGREELTLPPWPSPHSYLSLVQEDSGS